MGVLTPRSALRRRERRSRLFLFPAILGHLIEEGHIFSARSGVMPGMRSTSFALQIENVLERLLAGLLEHSNQLGDRPFISESATCVTD